MKHKLRPIISVGILCAIAAVGISFLFPQEYRADAAVLIISRTRTGVDPYTVVKSAERVGENLVAVIPTDDFYGKVITAPGFSLDQSPFLGATDRVRRKRWSKSLKGSVVFGTGLVRISAYNPDPAKAKELAAAAVSTLSAHGWEYVGGDVTIKPVDSPVATRFPARPNLLLNLILGFLAGAGIMVLIRMRK